ncbi:MAG: TauD/TfdA dioxygenase family protein, partial [Xanthobacteraceae bacterium]
MSYQTIDIRKSTPQIGAEIFGIDLALPLGNQQFQEVHDALMDRLVIFFRDQTISVEQQKDFARRFGKLHTHPASPNVVPGHPEVMVIAADENSEYIAGEDWHSDVSCDPEPPMGTMLYLTQVPPDGGGDTMFANMYLAYETLSDGLRRVLDGLTAVNSSAKADVTKTREDRIKDSGKTEARQEYNAEHPVVRTHPETGRRALYVNGGHTVRFSDMSAEESAPLLNYLFAHMVRPEFTCRFRWEPGSIALWDN